MLISSHNSVSYLCRSAFNLHVDSEHTKISHLSYIALHPRTTLLEFVRWFSCSRVSLIKMKKRKKKNVADTEQLWVNKIGSRWPQCKCDSFILRKAAESDKQRPDGRIFWLSVLSANYGMYLQLKNPNSTVSAFTTEGQPMKLTALYKDTVIWTFLIANTKPLTH